MLKHRQQFSQVALRQLNLHVKPLICASCGRNCVLQLNTSQNHASIKIIGFSSEDCKSDYCPTMRAIDTVRQACAKVIELGGKGTEQFKYIPPNEAETLAQLGRDIAAKLGLMDILATEAS